MCAEGHDITSTELPTGRLALAGEAVGSQRTIDTSVLIRFDSRYCLRKLHLIHFSEYFSQAKLE